jgi:hypothetical protein
MNSFRGVLDLQVRSVLDALRAQQDRRRREIETAAARKAEQLLADGRHRMRERVHKAVVEERQHRETALLESRHRIETAQRRHVQQQYRQFLHDAAPRLATELERRWHDDASRRSWCDMLIAEAADRLAPVCWTVEHPGDWHGDDTRWLERALAKRGLPRPELREDAGIVVGLRIRLGAACLDATRDGLLANRHAVEARLLAAWERQQYRERETAND